MNGSRVGFESVLSGLDSISPVDPDANLPSALFNLRATLVDGIDLLAASQTIVGLKYPPVPLVLGLGFFLLFGRTTKNDWQFTIVNWMQATIVIAVVVALPPEVTKRYWIVFAVVLGLRLWFGIHRVGMSVGLACAILSTYYPQPFRVEGMGNGVAQPNRGWIHQDEFGLVMAIAMLVGFVATYYGISFRQAKLR